MEVLCILRHRGVQLILAYMWARFAILVAGKGTGECFYFFCFFSFIPVPLSSLSLSFISSTISSVSFLLFSGRRHKMTTRVDVSLNYITTHAQKFYSTDIQYCSLRQFYVMYITRGGIRRGSVEGWGERIQLIPSFLFVDSKFQFHGKFWINLINLGYRVYKYSFTVLLFNKSILLHVNVCKIAG